MGFPRRRDASKELGVGEEQPARVWSGEALLDLPRDEFERDNWQGRAPEQQVLETAYPAPQSDTYEIRTDPVEGQPDEMEQPDDVNRSDDQTPQADEPRANAGVKLALILGHLEYLRTAADDRQRYDEVRELQVRKLYDELDEYKRNAQLDRMLDLARGVMLVIDKLDPSNPFPIPLDHVREELLECLRSVGVEEMAAPVGVQDPLYEVVVGFLESDFPEPSRIRQEGYLLGSQVIRKRLVEMRGPAEQ